MVIHEGT